MPNVFKSLQKWYSQQCDGEWEHSYGISIETIDNPGWHVKINLEDTVIAEREFEEIRVDRNEDDWLICRVAEMNFVGIGGPLNLEEIISIFSDWSYCGSPVVARQK